MEDQIHLAPTADCPFPSISWLTLHFQNSQIINQENSVIEVIKNENLISQSVGQIFSFQIRYSLECDAPKSLVIKIIQNQKIINQVSREAKFIELNKQRDFSQMKVYYTYTETSHPQKLLIIMEDLTQIATILNFFHGQQGDFSQEQQNEIENKYQVTNQQIWKMVFEEIAETHARNWNGKNLNKEILNDLKNHNWLEREKEGFEKSIQISKKAWIKTDKSQMSQKLIDIITNSLEKSNFEQMLLEKQKRPITLVHGDFHGKNCFWLYKEKKILMTDFAEVQLGDPISDIVQYIISEIEPSVRKKYELEILKAYWDKLILNGVNDQEFPFQKCLELYKSGIDRWLWFFPILAYMQYKVSYFHNNILSFIEDHSPDNKFFYIRYAPDVNDFIQ